MSWQMINRVLALAMIDTRFAESLLATPQEALNAYGIQLTPHELEVLCSCQSQTIPELSQELLVRLGPGSNP